MTFARLTQAALAAVLLSTPLFAAPGYLGVYLTEEDQSTQGAVVEDVAPDSPAAKAGLRRGDLIVSFNKNKVRTAAQLIPMLMSTEPGQSAKVVITRDGWRKAYELTLGDLPEGAAKREPRRRAPKLPPARESGFLGVYLRQGEAGEPIIDGVSSGSPAARAGLAKNDIVLAVNGNLVSDPAGMIAYVSRAGVGDSVEFTVRRRGREHKLTAVLGRRPVAGKLPPIHDPVKPAPAPAPETGKKPFIGLALTDSGGAGPLTVDDLRANGPADRFGIRKGDVILTVNGTAVKSIEDFVKSMRGKVGGEKVTFKIERDGWKHDVVVVLGSK